MRYKILVVDDDKIFTDTIATVLNDFEIITSHNTRDALKLLGDDIDMVLLDLVFDESNPEKMEGMEFLPEVVRLYPGIPVVVMTNFPSYEKSVEAIKLGAKDFLLKKNAVWIEWENRLRQYCRDYREIQLLKARTEELTKYSDSEIIGKSKNIDFIRRRIEDLARHSHDTSIFIQGETGTGKNLVVKYFRKFSPRRDKPYRETSLTELSGSILESELFGHIKGAFTGADRNKSGLFEEADKGILFLDEIGDYDLNAQSKIMRFLENKTILPVGGLKEKRLDLQLIMATNKDLKKLIAEGKFREDLYYRINQVRIGIPPLRDRREDIRILADYFFSHFRIKEHTNLIGISPEVYSLLELYNWPGNIRELKSVIIEACTNARMFNDSLLRPEYIRNEIKAPMDSESSSDSIEDIQTKQLQIELEEIDRALSLTMGQKAKAANILGMNADQIRYRVLKAKSINGLIDKYPNIKKYYNFSEKIYRAQNSV